MSEVSTIPSGQATLVPHLIIKGGAEAITFYKEALGATEIARMASPSGQIMHAEIQVGNSRLYIADECPEYGSLSPLSLGGSAVVLGLQVDDIDAAFARAVEAGATVVMPPSNMFWGDRYGKFADPFGHQWSMAQRIEELTYDEMRERGAKFMAEMGCQELAAKNEEALAAAN